MKFLKIESGKGYFSLDDGLSWNLLDLISKDALMTIIDKGIADGFEMSDPNQYKVENKTHEIIYSKLYDQFSTLNGQRDRFKDESEEMFKEAFAKYSE
tara:strand:- start:370 stop:663 length:294 start_codon:yes stop_codon:yes gene_type:complete